MCSIFMTLKNVFNIHDPEGTKRLFQLRVGLSPLRYHKKRHNFKDSPSDTCICGMSVETAEHFLIYCNLYNEVRVNLFQVINPILETKHLELPKHGSLVHFLLYGHANLSVELNTAVLTATITYIHRSARFDLN